MNVELLNLLQQQIANRPGLQNNPQMAAMMQSLMQKQQQAHPEDDRQNALQQQFKKMKRSRDQWKKNTEELAHTVRFFADLFGACSICFGDDADCPHCHGQGGISGLKADVEQLVTLVLPILKQAGLTIQPVAPNSTTTQDHNDRVPTIGENNHA